MIPLRMNHSQWLFRSSMGKDVSSNTFSKYLRFAAICDLILKLNKLFANICDLRFAVCCHFLMMPICSHILGRGRPSLKKKKKRNVSIIPKVKKQQKYINKITYLHFEIQGVQGRP